MRTTLVVASYPCAQDPSKLTLVELEYAPGALTPPHHHPGPVAVYVLEGAIESQVEGGPLTTYRRGEAFFEPARGKHAISRNASQIMPARFLVAVSFDGLEKHLFEDDRAADPAHPFNDPRYAGASILIVNRNFGSGSSREHAPQGLARAGIRAVIGESFSEIFQGNSSMLGLPCFVASHEDVAQLQTLIERAPETMVEADVETGVVTTTPVSGSPVGLSVVR